MVVTRSNAAQREMIILIIDQYDPMDKLVY